MLQLDLPSLDIQIERLLLASACSLVTHQANGLRHIESVLFVCCPMQKFSRRASLLDGWCWWWCRVVVYRDRDRDRVVVVSWASEANRSGFRFPGRCVEDDDSKRLGNVRRRKLHDA